MVPSDTQAFSDLSICLWGPSSPEPTRGPLGTDCAQSGGEVIFMGVMLEDTANRQYEPWPLLTAGLSVSWKG